eukprot:349842-Chlamydomonas_euryale.AAC.3
MPPWCDADSGGLVPSSSTPMRWVDGSYLQWSQVETLNPSSALNKAAQFLACSSSCKMGHIAPFPFCQRAATAAAVVGRLSAGTRCGTYMQRLRHVDSPSEGETPQDKCAL